jgi:hypothetical protein
VSGRRSPAELTAPVPRADATRGCPPPRDDNNYATFRLDDQLTFVHVVRSLHEPNPLLAVKAFGEFQVDIADRCDQPPVAEDLTEVGSYGFFTG